MIHGIDVSHHQGDIDWQAVAESGVKFAFLKVSEGITFSDPRFIENHWNCRKNKIILGGYHFFRPELNGEWQADNFLEAHDAWLYKCLPPVVDVETGKGKQFQENLIQWLAKIEGVTGRVPVIYTGPAFWKTIEATIDYSRYPLWIADYRGNRGDGFAGAVVSPGKTPEVPGPWNSWDFFQFSDKGKIPGINGPVDLDLFNGSIEDLKKLTVR